MFEKVFRAFLSVGAIVAVVGLSYYESKTGNNISPIAYTILAGVAFGASIDDVTKILSFRKKQ